MKLRAAPGAPSAPASVQANCQNLAGAEVAAAARIPPERPLHVSEDLWSTLSPAQQEFEVKAQPHGFHPSNVTPCVPAPEGSAYRASRGSGTRAERKAERATKIVTGTARYALVVLMLLLAWLQPTIVSGEEHFATPTTRRELSFACCTNNVAAGLLAS